VLLGIGAGLGAFALQALMATFALTIGVQGGLQRSTVLMVVRRRITRADGRAPGLRRAVRPTGPASRDDRRLRRRHHRRVPDPVVDRVRFGAWRPSRIPDRHAAGAGRHVRAARRITTEIFATGNRYTGASLGYQLSSTLGGGFAPLLAATLVAGTATGNGMLRVALFAATAALISTVTIAIAKESSKRNLIAVS